MFQPTMPAI